MQLLHLSDIRVCAMCINTTLFFHHSLSGVSRDSLHFARYHNSWVLLYMLQQNCGTQSNHIKCYQHPMCPWPKRPQGHKEPWHKKTKEQKPCPGLCCPVVLCPVPGFLIRRMCLSLCRVHQDSLYGLLAISISVTFLRTTFPPGLTIGPESSPCHM